MKKNLVNYIIFIIHISYILCECVFYVFKVQMKIFFCEWPSLIQAYDSRVKNPADFKAL